MNDESSQSLVRRLMSSRRNVPRLPSDDWDPRLLTALALAFLLLHALMGWLGRPPGILTGQDDATYLTLARSLRQGLGYRELFHVGWPFHTRYPPFYPAVLALWGGLFGEALDATALLNVAASMGALALVYRAVRRMASPSLALGCLGCLAVNPFLVARAGTAYSDPLFMFVSVAAVYFVFEDDDRTWGLIAAGALTIFAALTRSVGMTLVVALAIHWAISRKWRSVGLLSLAALLSVGTWLVWSATTGEHFVGGSYFADATVGLGEGGDPAGEVPGPADGRSALERGSAALIALGERVFNNSGEYLGLLIPWHLPFPTVADTPVDNALAAGITTLGLVSGVIVFWNKWRAASLYFVCYGLLLAVWPWIGGRFIEPLLPLLVHMLLIGVLYGARSWIGDRYALAITGTLAIVIFTFGGINSLKFVSHRLGCSSLDLRGGGEACLNTDRASYFRALGFVRQNSAPDARFLTAKPEPLYWHTGRQSVDDHRAVHTPASDFYSYLDEQDVDYVLLGNLRWMEGRLANLLEGQCQRLEPVEHFPPRTWLFRIGPRISDVSGSTSSGQVTRGASGEKTDETDQTPSAEGCEKLREYQEAKRNVSSTQGLPIPARVGSQ